MTLHSALLHARSQYQHWRKITTTMQKIVKHEKRYPKEVDLNLPISFTYAGDYEALKRWFEEAEAQRIEAEY